MRSEFWVPVALLIAALGTAERTQNAGAPFPPRLDKYLSAVGSLSDAERKALLSGQPVSKLLEADQSKEVAVLGAIWVNVPRERYVQRLTDIEAFERGGGFQVTKKISTPPRLEDFAALQLPDDDIKDLETCDVGACEIKLGEAALQRFKKEVNWRGPDAKAAANTLMRQLALEYVRGYLEGGNERLAVYRDRSRPTFVAQEFREMTGQMPELTTFMPNLRRYLLEFPTFTIPKSTSFLYWQQTEFGLKPTIRISHVTIREGPDETVVASKMLYATHYFWTGLELRVLLPDPARGQGFWFVTVNRSRSDGLSGFTGSVLRGRVGNEVQKTTMAGLQNLKGKLEGGR
jgi:hypothetical protein